MAFLVATFVVMLVTVIAVVMLWLYLEGERPWRGDQWLSPNGQCMSPVCCSNRVQRQIDGCSDVTGMIAVDHLGEIYRWTVLVSLAMS